jgi:hypothetical protein
MLKGVDKFVKVDELDGLNVGIPVQPSEQSEAATHRSEDPV